MKFSFITILTQLLLIKTGLTRSAEPKKYVDLVMSIDQYYDEVNRNDSYTMVEFTTSWCHHCKNLKPQFLALTNMYEDDETKPPVTFLEVNCEIFGTTICRDMPGFPMIYLVQPRVKPLILPTPDDSQPFWKRVWTKIYNRIQDPMWQLDPERIIEYKGKREAVPMREFIEGIRLKDKLTSQAQLAMKEDRDCGDDALCSLGKSYIKNTLSQLSSEQLRRERSKLETLIRNARNSSSSSEEAVETVKFKLEILNHVDSANEEQNLHDEL